MEFKPGQLVWLNKDIPEGDLHSGQVGVVCSRWCPPLCYYEVEFAPPMDHIKIHVVLEESLISPMKMGEQGNG